MKNPKSPKERNLLKGAIMRVFSRSELRKEVINSVTITHSDPLHPRVKKWSVCQNCLVPTPTYKMQVDHIEPKVPLDKTLEQMTWDELIDNTWCEKVNLQPICLSCHKLKTSLERKQRKSRIKTVAK